MAYLTGRMGMEPILSVRLSVTIGTIIKLDGNGDCDGVGKCKQTLKRLQWNLRYLIWALRSGFTECDVMFSLFYSKHGVYRCMYRCCFWLAICKLFRKCFCFSFVKTMINQCYWYVLVINDFIIILIILAILKGLFYQLFLWALLNEWCKLTPLVCLSIRARLHLARATHLRQHWKIALKSIPCILCCIVTPGRSISINTLKWVCNPFWTVPLWLMRAVSQALSQYWRFRQV